MANNTCRYARTTKCSSNPAEQNQDQDDGQNEAESTAPVIAGTVKRPTAQAAKSTEQCDDQNDEKDRSDGHFSISPIGLSKRKRNSPGRIAESTAIVPPECNAAPQSPENGAASVPFVQRLILEIFVPSMLNPAINPDWSKMKA
jgi:hypothetical protein